MNFLFQALIYLVLTGVGLIVEAIKGQDQAASEQRAPSGVRGTLDFGGDLAPRFIAGRYASAGQLRYGGTWGNAGETPNAYQSRVIEVSCLPVRGFPGWFVFGERVTLDSVKTGDLGYAVLEYRRAGQDYLWINPYTGGQTSEDPLMLAQFGGHPTRPYAGMVGRGTGYFVVTALVNRGLFPRFPEVLAEVDGIALDDPRGDNAHANPMVAIYTLLKGLSYGGQWIWGPQKVTAANFRTANLVAEMDKCDAIVDGRTQFTFGMDIALDEQPMTVVGELLKACAGRWADVGGVYKFLVGTPGEPVISITDEDLLITEQQISEPFPGLENLHNAMGGTYPEPAEAWSMKEAPPRYRSDLEAQDDGRRLMFSTEYRAVSQAVQVQHLMRLALEEARRFRRHTQTMPPDWYEIEPLDAIAWTSARNGYEAKRFLVTVQEDLPTANQFVGLQEIDPADYSWDSDFELPWDVAPLVIDRPAPQITTGFAAVPFTVQGPAGEPRRPGIQVLWDSGLVDVSHVRVQVREGWGDKGTIADATLGYDPEVADPSAVIANPAILPNAAYEVRGLYVPYSGRITRWSNQDSAGTDGDWISVTTPNVRLGPLDIENLFDLISDEIVPELQSLATSARTARDNFERLGSLIAEQDLANFNDREAVKRELRKKTGDLEASFTEIIEVALGPGGAIATALSQLYAAMGGNTSQVLVRYAAEATPVGVEASWGLQLSTDDGATFGSAAFLVQVKDGESQIILDADRTIISTSGGEDIIALFNADGAFVGSLIAGYISNLSGTSFWDIGGTGRVRFSTT